MKNNKFVRVIRTKKYKDINLYLRFSVENKNNNLEKICLLSKMIGDISKKYPTKVEMTACRDMLYGISCDCSYKSTVNLVTLSVHYTFINPRFVDATISEYNSFIKETLFNSIIDENSLKEAKTTISASITRDNDKPAYLSKEIFVEIVGKDNKDFMNYSRGDKFINNLKKVKLDSLIEMYKFIINKAQLNVYLCGDLTDDDINQLVTYRFDNRLPVNIMTHRVKYNKKRKIVDNKPISQTYLSIVYSTPFSKKHKEYFSWMMGNYLLGIGPASLLFNEIREKMSLCYSINSQAYKQEGLVRIATSIDAKNVDIAIKQIMAQVDRICKKDYDPKQLENTKSYVIDAFKAINDDIDSLIDFYFDNDLSNMDYSIEEFCEKLNSVTVDDISRVYKKYVPYFNHVLLGSKHE